jgi:lipid-A-disaccharide synthase
LFSFEHEWLLNNGVKSAWVAHPLLKVFKGYSPHPDFTKRFEKKKGRIIAFMPGSRQYDIRWHIDELIKAALEIRKYDYYPIFSVAPGLYGKLRKDLFLRIESEDIEHCEEEGRELLSVAEAAVGVSGTISVESMLLKRFMVVVYNGNLVSWLVWKTLIHNPCISIPNVLTCGIGNNDKMVYPELIGKRMSSDVIVKELRSYLENEDKKREVEELLSGAIAKMGSEDAGKFWAEQILKMVGNI